MLCRQRQVTTLKSRLRSTEETLARVNHDGSRTSSRSASPNMDEIKSWPGSGSRHTTPDKAGAAAATPTRARVAVSLLETIDGDRVLREAAEADAWLDDLVSQAQHDLMLSGSPDAKTHISSPSVISISPSLLSPSGLAAVVITPAKPGVYS